MLRRRGNEVDVVSALEVLDHVTVARLLARGRPAETGEAIRWPLQVCREQTEPVLDFFRHRGLLEVIDGVGTPEEVAERLFEMLARRGFLRPRSDSRAREPGRASDGTMKWTARSSDHR